MNVCWQSMCWQLLVTLLASTSMDMALYAANQQLTVWVPHL